MAGSLSDFCTRMQNYCWDESHGYSPMTDGTDHMGHPNFDCSGLVGRCLYEAGYNYPSTHVGTAFMKPDLITAGFQIIPVTSVSQVPQSGDIVVMNHYPIGNGGHTFLFMENILAYTDPNADSANTGIVNKAKVEASSKRGRPDTEAGDTKKNNTGAYWQVWCHAYAPGSLYGNYDPTNPNDEIYIARDPNGLNGAKVAAFIAMRSMPHYRMRGRRR